jgi:hypothetical protein
MQRTADGWAAERQRATEALFAQLVVPKESFPETLFWQGTPLVTRDIEKCVSNRILSEVIWELYEVNFRLELLALDRVVNPSAWAIPPDGNFNSVTRWHQFHSLFPDGKIVVESIPKTNDGFSAEKLEDRLPYLRALQMLLTTWPQSDQGPYRSAMNLSLDDGVSPGLASTVELALASCYCQAYFSYFGRAAVIPRGVPLRSFLGKFCPILASSC